MTPGHLIEGLFGATGASISAFDCEECFQFALWFRELVPEEQPLVFNDDDLSLVVEVRKGMSMEQLMAPFEARDKVE